LTIDVSLRDGLKQWDGEPVPYIKIIGGADTEIVN